MFFGRSTIDAKFADYGAKCYLRAGKNWKDLRPN